MQNGPSKRINKVAEKIVAKIVEDFTDRRGLRQAWESIDPGTQGEILAQWKALIAIILDQEMRK
jgi:hypothetical protein